MQNSDAENVSRVDTPNQEWYAVLYGRVPREVVLGREAAVVRLIRDAKVTKHEQLKIKKFLEQIVVNPGEGVGIVGFWAVPLSERNHQTIMEPDRSIARVTML